MEDYIKAKGWMNTYSGEIFYIFEPDIEKINIQDIAHALSMICRFNGHVKKFYSVAQHSVLVSHICSPKYALEGLMHDATESYCGDMIRPLKCFFPDFKKHELIIEQAIWKKFNLIKSKKMYDEVKRADDIALVTEARDLLPNAINLKLDHKALDKKIIPLSPGVAKKKFLQRFEELKDARKI